MRFLRPALVLTLAAGAVVGLAGSASAHPADVVTGTNGTCASGYYELAQLGDTTVCVHVGWPDATVKNATAPCPTGYSEYSVLAGSYGVCVRFSHT